MHVLYTLIQYSIYMYNNKTVQSSEYYCSKHIYCNLFVFSIYICFIFIFQHICFNLIYFSLLITLHVKSLSLISAILVRSTCNENNFPLGINKVFLILILIVWSSLFTNQSIMSPLSLPELRRLPVASWDVAETGRFHSIPEENRKCHRCEVENEMLFFVLLSILSRTFT